MKTVNKTPLHTFSGFVTEDWTDHVNEFELQCARKHYHYWTVRQFFYTLRTTLVGLDSKTWIVLEREPDLDHFCQTGSNVKRRNIRIC